MQTITSSAAMAAFLAQPLDPTLRRLLADRVAQLAEYDGHDLGELARFVILESDDTLDALRGALNFVPHHYPIEAITSHDGWVQVVVILDDAGYGVIILMPEAAGIPTDGLQQLFAPSEDPPFA